MRHVAFAAAVTLAAAALRLVRLAETPGWDGDEGYNLEIARRLADGHAQAFAVAQSFVQHPIGFYALLAPPVGAFGADLVVARALSAVVTSLAAGVIYLSAHRAAGARAAALASIAFATAHFIVLHNRLAYTYNLLLLWTAVTLWCVTRFEETRHRRWHVGSVVAAACGLLTDQVGIALPCFVALRRLPQRREAVVALVAGVVPAAVFAAAMLLRSPESALEDWSKSFSRVAVETPGTAGGPAVRVALWFVNYLHLLRAEWWWPAAVIGLFCVSELRARRRVLTLAGTLVAPTFALRELDPFFRTAIPLFVPAAVGLGALLDAGLRAVLLTVPGRAGRALVAALVVALPLGLEAARSAGAAATRFTTRFDWALVTEQESVRAAAGYVNQHASEDDVVLVSPHVAWLYRARAADFFQAVTWSGAPIAFYPAEMARVRFRFDPSPGAARFAVVDSFWRRWAEASPPLARLTAEIEAWPEALRVGEISVRRNPRRA